MNKQNLNIPQGILIYHKIHLFLNCPNIYGNSTEKVEKKSRNLKNNTLPLRLH